MSTALDRTSLPPIADESTFESALAAHGWEQDNRTSWQLRAERGDCRLVELVQHDRWRKFRLTGGAAPRSSAGGVLDRNFSVFGPAKLIAQPGDRAMCRIDVPDPLASTGGHAFDAVGRLQIADAPSLLAAAVTAFATGRYGAAESTELDSVVANDLEQAGWSTSNDGGRVHIHMHLPGVYRRLAIECDARTGVKLAAELVDLTELDDDCIRAVLHLANAANTRLPLVRLAISSSKQKRSLRGEIGFGAALIPGTFLLLALHAFETAIECCVRELEALRDPELARLVLATADARDSQIRFPVGNLTSKGD